LSETPELTIKVDPNGRPIRSVTFELRAAMQNLLNHVDSTPRAAMLTLQCLTASLDQPAPTVHAVSVFEALMTTEESRLNKRQLSRLLQGRVDLDKGLSSLKRLGCVIIEDKKARINKAPTMQIKSYGVGFEIYPS
jgi:hypothetical protein